MHCGTCSSSSSSKQPMANSTSSPLTRFPSTSSLSRPRCCGHELQGSQISENRQQSYRISAIPHTQKPALQTVMKHSVSIIEQQDQRENNHEAYKKGEKFENSVCLVCKNRRPKIGWKRDFTYAELYEATQGFSQKNFLSEGGFGAVYRGDLNGLKIAVKQHICASLQGEKEFMSEVDALSKARHANVVMLLGSCSEGNNRLLVYEYVCNGSLDQHLSQFSRNPPSWEDRIRIAVGAAKGLMYLHNSNIIHRDMTANNILVTHNYETLLGDFGLARIVPDESSYTTDFVGTPGYIAPEYAETGEVSTKTDVYSFGVVLLQLISGMRTTDKRLGEKSLVEWARSLSRERKYQTMIDERMANSHDCHQLFWMTRLAEQCLKKDPQKRITMDNVVMALTLIMEGCCNNVGKNCCSSHLDSSDVTSDSTKPESSMQDFMSDSTKPKSNKQEGSMSDSTKPDGNKQDSSESQESCKAEVGHQLSLTQRSSHHGRTTLKERLLGSLLGPKASTKRSNENFRSKTSFASGVLSGGEAKRGRSSAALFPTDGHPRTTIRFLF